jgi:CelD/BcsL family acetyltransferase involved in cellulose biosynthesis
MVNLNALTSDALSELREPKVDSPGPVPRVDTTVSPRVATSVDVITDSAAFVAMESEWNETVDRAGVTHPFLRHEWLRTWWECFGADRRLHIVVVRSGGRIQAIAPLMWETAQMYRVPVRRLRLLENGHTPRADFVVVERPQESYRAIWQALLDTSMRWDVLQLSQIPQTSPTLAAMSTLAAAHGHATGLWHSDDSPYLAITQSWDEYAATLTPKFRQNLRNRLTRVTQLGHPALEVVEDRAAIRDACADACRLEASTWKHAEGTSIESEPATRRFYTELAERAADHGWLRLLFLTVNGRRIATAYSARYQDRLLFLKTGYDPEFAKCSPFTVLSSLAVRHAFDEGLAEVDFLGDDEPWKLEWTRATRSHEYLFIFGRTARARLVHQVKFRLKPALERWRHAGAAFRHVGPAFRHVGAAFRRP